VDSAHGICVLGNKALISCGDDVFWLIDDNGDDKADRKELLFTKIGGAQHDHGIHAFHFGPDGRLYFNFGNAGKQLCDKDGNLITDIHGNLHQSKQPPVSAGHGLPLRTRWQQRRDPRLELPQQLGSRRG
jgi:glucose/arabinose dehydrogenase